MLLVIGAALFGTANAGADGAAQAPRNDAEAEFRKTGAMMIRMPTELEEDAAALSILFTPETLATHSLYLVDPESPASRFVVDRKSGLRGEGELLVTPSGMALFLDGARTSADLAGWETYWITAERALPKIRQVKPARLDFADAFMREKLADGPCRVVAGQAGLLQHGGGMPTSEQERSDAAFERAVNPFSVQMADRAVIAYDPPGNGLRGDFSMEGRFYFGVPVTGNVVDVNTLPLGTDMLLAASGPDGARVAFGWIGKSREFVLRTRAGDAAEWVTRARWSEARPPVTSWMRLGLSVECGSRVVGFLDGQKLLEADLDWRVNGPVLIMSGRDPVECDDIRIRSLPLPPSAGTEYFVKSRQFAGKALKNNSADPKQFRQWAESAAAFLHHRWVKPDRSGSFSATTTALPLIGDFEYEALTTAEESGKLPEGNYSFRFLKADVAADVHGKSLENRVVLDATWKGGTWTLNAGDREFALDRLRLARRADQQHRVCVWHDEAWQPVSDPLPEPVHLAVCRVFDRPFALLTPSDFHQRVVCRNLVNEFFEEAPTDWSWVDGAFRMAARWACQNQWNFMAGGSTEQPTLVSKRTFRGNQTHEAYMSIRPMLPWDAGDESFDFDPVQDRRNGHPIHSANQGWYSRRDLNFSFCMDGTDPLSGYSVVFGGYDNRETMFLRKGQVIARTREIPLLFPKQSDFHVVHWFWVRFLVRREGDRLRVWINDRVAFDFTDPEPLEGGHIAFWSVRNGFVVSRVSSMADDIGYEPRSLYVGNEMDEEDPWVPLKRDRVAVSKAPGDPARRRITNLRGGGFFAVRYTPPQRIDLEKTPVLRLPLDLGTAKINLHVQVDGKAYLVPVGQPQCSEMKTILAPRFEKGECFRLRDFDSPRLRAVLMKQARPRNGIVYVNLLDELRRIGHTARRPRLECLTLGNSANPDYLLAGGGGNETGAWYEVGTPSFVKQGDREWTAAPK